MCVPVAGHVAVFVFDSKVETETSDCVSPEAYEYRLIASVTNGHMTLISLLLLMGASQCQDIEETENQRIYKGGRDGGISVRLVACRRMIGSAHAAHECIKAWESTRNPTARVVQNSCASSLPQTHLPSPTPSLAPPTMPHTHLDQEKHPLCNLYSCFPISTWPRCTGAQSILCPCIFIPAWR